MNAQPCPCCQRPFESIFDYPRVRVTRIEVLPPPEQVIDTFSSEARDMHMQAIRKLHQREQEGHTLPSNAFVEVHNQGIDVTQNVAQAHQALQGYFDHLKSLQGEELTPNGLFPNFELSREPDYYKIPGSELHVTVSEPINKGYVGECQVEILGKEIMDGGRMAMIHFLCTVANIHYEGRLVGPCGESS